METNLEPPNQRRSPTISTAITATDFLSPPPAPPLTDDFNDDDFYIDDSNSSTPYVSAPSSPGRSSYLPSGYFFSAPASPMHFVLATAPARSSAAGGLIPTFSDASSSTGSFEFEFSARFDSPAPATGAAMSSADELFLNGKIRPMKLCAHLQRPQKLPPLTLLESDRENEDEDEDDDEEVSNDIFLKSSRESRLHKNRSQRRRTRSLSPLRSTTPFEWFRNDNDNHALKIESENINNEENVKEKENESGTTPSGSSSRCSSAGRSSKRWVFLKDFLRSKSEGRSNNKFWHNINISFSPAKERRDKGSETASFVEERKSGKKEGGGGGAMAVKKPVGGKRRSAHELHYAANRAQAEEMRKKTFLPYRKSEVHTHFINFQMMVKNLCNCIQSDGGWEFDISPLLTHLRA